MFRNYLIVAVRNLLRQRVYSLINITGLAIGMASVILIGLFVSYELSYDRHHEKADRVHLMWRERHRPGTETFYKPLTSGALAEAMRDAYPEVEATARLILFYQSPWVRYGDDVYSHPICIADESIFDLFTLPIVAGERGAPLREPFTIAVTETVARKIFGASDPIGKTISVEYNELQGDYRVTAILKDHAPGVALGFEFLVSRASYDNDFWNAWLPTQSFVPTMTYVLLKEGASPAKLEAKLPNLMERHMGPEIRAHNTWHLQPIDETHLYSQSDYGLTFAGGDIRQIYAFGIIASFVMVIACVNFTNLSTAKSLRRAREVGVRKVVGAYRSGLIFQFLGESMLMSFLALLVALGVVEFVLPYFNAFTGKPLSLTQEGVPVILLSLAGIALVVGIVAGAYPAFFLSAFDPSKVASSGGLASSRGARIRKGLVITQFAISVFLLIATAVVYRQIDFIRSKDLGFDKELVVEMPIFWADRRLPRGQNQDLGRRYAAIKEDFLSHPRVLAATTLRFPQGSYTTSGVYRSPDAPDGSWQMGIFGIDQDYFNFFGIEMVSGRPFTDAENIAAMRTRVHGLRYVINETAARQLGWDDPIGKRLYLDTVVDGAVPGTIVGVSRDFHTWSLRKQIEPVVFSFGGMKTLAVKVAKEDLQGTLRDLEKKWLSYIPSRPFRYTFLDTRLAQLYNEELKTGRTYTAFSGLAIFVACLGLVGLVSYTAEQRTKEIGIRKVLGASVGQVVKDLSQEFMLLVVAANVVGWPVAFFTTRAWLNGFAYRVDQGVGLYILCGVATVVIAFLSVGYQSLRAAGSDPVTALRHE